MMAPLACIAGLFFGLCTYLVLRFILPQEALTLAVLAGSSFGLLLYGYLILHARRMGRVYGDYEKTLPPEPLLKTNGNFRIDGGRVRNGCLYFWPDRIVCASLDEKPHITEHIPRSSVRQLRVDKGLLELTLADGRSFSFILPDLENIQTTLRRHNWL